MVGLIVILVFSQVVARESLLIKKTMINQAATAASHGITG